MTSWEIASKELARPLSPSVVKSRTQGGSTVSYVEGWHVINEANRIFGFDGWSRETIELKCVSERERKIGKSPNQRDGFGVTYTARVKVVALGVAREGAGSGHGIDADCGQAHESAIKEAETDAMKRAFMTFGNPFGLALYDKQRRNVGDDAEEKSQDESVPEANDEKIVDDLVCVINLCESLKELLILKETERFKEEYSSIPDGPNYDRFVASYKAKKAALTPKPA